MYYDGWFWYKFSKFSSHPPTEYFLNLLGTYFFSPHILQPTLITGHSGTLIDNILFNSISHHTISGNIIYNLTDHLPNFLIVNTFSTLPKEFKLYKRDYSKYCLINEQECVFLCKCNVLIRFSVRLSVQHEWL
jgi:hypothetical protein